MANNSGCKPYQPLPPVGKPVTFTRNLLTVENDTAFVGVYNLCFFLEDSVDEINYLKNMINWEEITKGGPQSVLLSQHPILFVIWILTHSYTKQGFRWCSQQLVNKNKVKYMLTTCLHVCCPCLCMPSAPPLHSPPFQPPYAWGFVPPPSVQTKMWGGAHKVHPPFYPMPSPSLMSTGQQVWAGDPPPLPLTPPTLWCPPLAHLLLCQGPSHGGSYMDKGTSHIKIRLLPVVVSGDCLASVSCFLLRLLFAHAWFNDPDDTGLYWYVAWFNDPDDTGLY